MIIKGSKIPAAAMALLGGIVLGLAALVSLALGQPAVAWLGWLFVALVGVAALFLLRPTSLALEGADLVYRVGRRETRVARDRVSNCALAGQRWAFTDATGAQVFSLPSLQFNERDLTTFCNKAGIRGFAPPLGLVEQGRKDVRSAKWTRALGVVLTGIVLVVLGFFIWLAVSAQDAYVRYGSAPICEGASSASTCRLQTQARVTSAEEKRTSTTIHLSVVGSGGDYITSVNKPAAPGIGEVVSVEVWNGEVTRLRETDTLDNPKLNPNLNDNWVLAAWLLFAIPGAAMAAAGHVQLRSARARLRAAASGSGSVA